MPAMKLLCAGKDTVDYLLGAEPLKVGQAVANVSP